ncbi:hypothetical protein LINGRAHAP2_LOCUS15627, partial [Linum grandiflorum]
GFPPLWKRHACGFEVTFCRGSLIICYLRTFFVFYGALLNGGQFLVAQPTRQRYSSCLLVPAGNGGALRDMLLDTSRVC